MAMVREPEIDRNAAQRAGGFAHLLQAVADAQLPDVLVYRKAGGAAKSPAQMVGEAPTWPAIAARSRGWSKREANRHSASWTGARCFHGENSTSRYRLLLIVYLAGLASASWMFSTVR